MKLLIIYTHPNHRSLSYAFLQEVMLGSEENAAIEEIKVLDLYEEGFNPILVFNDTKRRRDMHADPDSRSIQGAANLGRQNCIRISDLVGTSSGYAYGIYRSDVCFGICV